PLRVDGGNGLDPLEAAGDDHRLALPQAVQRILRYPFARAVFGGIDDRHDVHRAIGRLLEDRAFAETPIDRLVAVIVPKIDAGDADLAQIVADIVGHRRCFEPDVFLRLNVIATRELVGVFQNAARIRPEPDTGLE